MMIKFTNILVKMVFTLISWNQESGVNDSEYRKQFVKVGDIVEMFSSDRI